jgi:hypothetical protein
VDALLQAEPREYADAAQRQALIEDIACTVTREEYPALQQACQEVQWACWLDRRTVLDALITATAKKSRRAMQNYMALVDFLLRIDWQHLHAEHQVTMKLFRTECAASSGQKCITCIAVDRLVLYRQRLAAQ